MSADDQPVLTYKVRLLGTTGEAGPLTTRRRRHVGDFVNLPVRRDGQGEPGDGHIWCVTSIEDDLLVLEYVRPHDTNSN